MRTLYYVVGVALDDDNNVIGANVEAETALNDPETPVFDDESNEWRAIRPATEGPVDDDVLAKINAALAGVFGGAS